MLQTDTEKREALGSEVERQGAPEAREGGASRAPLRVDGTWDMVHDDWRGTLRIHPPDQAFEGVDGACVYRHYRIDGTYTGNDGIAHPVRGTLGGKDSDRRRGEPCPQSSHRIAFTIDLGGGQPPQPFEGYLFTHGGSGMAGRTWWAGIPFGWYAIRRP
ncbi:hypothetical protein [Myxococcus sp. RHSTA-1-4]|uniref:hypothetical protein n=1 Tax=Myxococcus sp. RHSTA-1-4 TaxID=2874601 RepID=UPI001CBD14A3|nr:hypothetical protein [Myxococcus sp. RHSTA-1-4]MBZ4421102.1 hypothetical protein [Myxococcus sp. RHSTA-1-4]